ncbi:MAG: hypothetical protein ACE5GT_10170 [Rhodospirillales bacterium]
MTRASRERSQSVRIALVVFSGRADLKWLRFLKPGFRHCFAVLEVRGRWIVYDPLSNRTEIDIVDGITLTALVHGYRAQGLRVVPVALPPARVGPQPLGFYSCVEAVKRVLGIRAPHVITPWNLYNFLKKCEMCKKFLDMPTN